MMAIPHIHLTLVSVSVLAHYYHNIRTFMHDQVSNIHSYKQVPYEAGGLYLPIDTRSCCATMICIADYFTSSPFDT